MVRANLLAQQTRFAETIAVSGTAMPALVPSPTEIAAAAPAFGDLSPTAVADALRSALSTLEAADAELTAYVASVATAGRSRAAPGTLSPVPAPAAVSVQNASPSLRNGLVYGAYAVGVLVTQLVLLAALDEQRTLPLLSPFCLFGLPALAWLAGWLTIGLAFRPGPGDAPIKRSPRLGALICFAPDLLLCAGLAGLYLVR